MNFLERALQDGCADSVGCANTAISGAVLSGVSLVATAVIAGVYVKRRNAARGRLGVLGGRIRGGAMFGASLRFQCASIGRWSCGVCRMGRGAPSLAVARLCSGPRPHISPRTS